MNKNSKFFPLFIASILAAGVFMGSFLNISVPKQNLASNHKNKLNKLIGLIDNEYIDNVNTDSIVDLTITNILDKLDPHSVYIPKNEISQVEQSMKGSFVGIGVNFYMHKDTVTVIKTVANGPSQKAGIQAGDRILYANNDKLFDRKLPNDSLYAKFKGKIGTFVNLTIYRKSENKKLVFKVKRNVVDLKSVDVALKLNESVGYIKINRFSETTYDEFIKNLLSLKKSPLNSLIIDLRDNGGGYMEEAIKIADDFLKDKQLIVFTKSKNGAIEKTFATNNGNFEKGKIFILVNENSASASEILAGAIQDNDRGAIVGRRTFGKGLVQKEVNFDDGSAVRLTIARYYTPAGRSIQKSYKKGSNEYFKDFEKRFLSGELYDKDSIKVNDSLKFKTAKGRIVYGGGGIVPDIFVPIQLYKGDRSSEFLMESGALDYFVFEELDKERTAFKNLNFDEFLLKMNNSKSYFNKLQKYLMKNGVMTMSEKNKPLIEKYIVGEFTKQLFGDEKYYQFSLKDDAMIKAVLELDLPKL